jgi:hypothetical protein
MRKVLLVATLFLLTIASACGGDDASTPADNMPATPTSGAPAEQSTSFTFVVIPDTQYYMAKPELSATFAAQTQWIVDSRDSLNIAFVSHVGDIVEHIDQVEQEWIDAGKYMAILDDNGIKNNVVAGNHDASAEGVATMFDKYFPAGRYEKFDWYGGYMGEDASLDPANRGNMNNYELFSAGGLDVIVLHLEPDIPDDVLAWAGRILKENPNRRAIISTHAFLTPANDRPTAAAFRSDGTAAEAVWEQLIKPNCNVFLVVNGHYPGEGRRTDTNACGDPVHQVLQDYQFRANGGDGWLRYFTFKPDENKIYVYTYSPTRKDGAGDFETDADSQFTLDYDMQSE